MKCTCGKTKSLYSESCRGCFYKRLSVLMRNNKNGAGRTMTEEQKQKLSKAHKGRKLSSEHKEKLSKAKIGYTPWNK